MPKKPKANKRPAVGKVAKEILKKEGVNIPEVKTAPTYTQIDQEDEAKVVATAVAKTKGVVIPKNRKGRKKLSPEERQKRNMFVVDLYRKNFLLSSITQLIKAKTAEQIKSGYHEPWGEISERQVIRIMKEWHATIKAGSATEEREENDAMRRMHLDRMGRYSELLAREFTRKESQVKAGKEHWKPFEKVGLIAEMAKIEQNIIENENWNMSRANMQIQIQNNTVLAMVQRESEKVVLQPSPQMLQLRELITNIETDEDIA